MKRLSSAEIDLLPGIVQRPGYDRHATKAGIVHIGIGAFHRAHQAVYTEDVLNLDGGDWAIIGASLRSPDVRDQLIPQNCLYTLLERNINGEKIRLVGALKDILVGPEDPTRLITVIAGSNIKIVSLTITEKGYYLDPATGKIQLEHQDIQHDLKNPDRPKTVYGYLLAALKIRRANGQPLTIMSCDNLVKNSKILRDALLAFTASGCPDMASWITRHCRFPCSMVDRMVPATTAQDRLAHAQNIRLLDHALVTCETFRQWVIEDDFANGRPAWEKAGALMVKDVSGFEAVKLRLLNGAHSAIAYLGFLAGYDYIYQAAQNKTIARYITKLIDEEITPGLTLPEGINIEEYKKNILTRFANPTVKYTTAQVAMDGSQKLPQRWLNSLHYQLDHGGQYDLLCLAIASWIRYLQGVDEKGEAYVTHDPLRLELDKLISNKDLSLRETVAGVISLQVIFGGKLHKNNALLDRITYWLENLTKHGALKSLELSIRNNG